MYNMKSSNEELYKMIKKRIKDIRKVLKNHNITYAAIFGSYVKGKQKKRSDIDIVFDYKKNSHFSLFTMSSVKFELQDILGKKVDLVPINGLKSEIKEEVINTMVPIYEER